MHGLGERFYMCTGYDTHELTTVCHTSSRRRPAGSLRPPPLNRCHRRRPPATFVPVGDPTATESTDIANDALMARVATVNRGSWSQGPILVKRPTVAADD